MALILFGMAEFLIKLLLNYIDQLGTINNYASLQVIIVNATVKISFVC